MNPIIANMLDSLRHADVKLQAGAPVSGYQPDINRLAALSGQISRLEGAGFMVVDMDVNAVPPRFVVRLIPAETDRGGLYIKESNA